MVLHALADGRDPRDSLPRSEDRQVAMDLALARIAGRTGRRLQHDAGGRLAGLDAAQPRERQKSTPAIVFVHRDGKRHKFTADTPYGKEIGGGHSHARLLFAGGKVWVNGTTNPIAAIDLSQPGDKAHWDLTYAKLPRPVGCTVTRATPNFIFGSLTTYSLDENAIQHTNAARSVCDVGATPAAGMTFITPTQCFCASLSTRIQGISSATFCWRRTDGTTGTGRCVARAKDQRIERLADVHGQRPARELDRGPSAAGVAAPVDDQAGRRGGRQSDRWRVAGQLVHAGTGHTGCSG